MKFKQYAYVLNINDNRTYQGEINMECTRFSKQNTINRGNVLNDYTRRIFTNENYGSYHFSNFSSRRLLNFFQGINNEKV